MKSEKTSRKKRARPATTSDDKFVTNARYDAPVAAVAPVAATTSNQGARDYTFMHRFLETMSMDSLTDIDDCKQIIAAFDRICKNAEGNDREIFCKLRAQINRECVDKYGIPTDGESDGEQATRTRYCAESIAVAFKEAQDKLKVEQPFKTIPPQSAVEKRKSFSVEKGDHATRFMEALKEKAAVIIASVLGGQRAPTAAESHTFEKLTGQMEKTSMSKSEIDEARRSLYTYANAESSQKTVDDDDDDDDDEVGPAKPPLEGGEDTTEPLLSMWSTCHAAYESKFPPEFREAMERMSSAQKVSFMKVISEITSGSGTITDEHMESMKGVAQSISGLPQHHTDASPVSEFASQCKANAQAALDASQSSDSPVGVDKWVQVGRLVCLSKRLIRTGDETYTPKNTELDEFLASFARIAGDKTQSMSNLFSDILVMVELEHKDVIRQAHAGSFNHKLTFCRLIAKLLCLAMQDIKKRTDRAAQSSNEATPPWKAACAVVEALDDEDDEEVKNKYAQMLVKNMSAAQMQKLAVDNGITISPDVKKKMDGAREPLGLAAHPLTEVEKARMILAEAQGSQAWNEAVDAILGARKGVYPPDWKELILDRRLWNSTTSQVATPAASETTFKGLKGGFLNPSKSASKKSIVAQPGGYLECVDSELARGIFNPPIASYTKRQEFAYQQLSVAPEEVLSKLDQGTPEDIIGISELSGIHVDDIMHARHRIKIDNDKSLTEEERVDYMRMYNGSRPDYFSRAERIRKDSDSESGDNLLEDEEDEEEEDDSSNVITFVERNNTPMCVTTTRAIKAGEQILPEDVTPLEITSNPDGTWSSGRPGISAKCDRITKLVAKGLAGRMPNVQIALKAMGKYVEKKVNDCINNSKLLQPTAGRIRWAPLFEVGFEAITKDGRNCYVGIRESGGAFPKPDAVRCTAKGLEELVLPLDDSTLMPPPVPINRRDFIEKCIHHGATMEDACIESERIRVEAEEKRQEERARMANQAREALEADESEREAQRLYRESDEFKRLQHERNQKSKANEKAGKAAKAAALKAEAETKARKATADKFAAAQAQADECIDNGIKYGQILWDEGDRKAARARLGVANKKHLANASDGGKARSRAKRDEWDSIEEAERESKRAREPTLEHQLEHQLAIVADDKPAPVAPHESQSQRKARREREKAAEEAEAQRQLAMAAQRVEEERVQRLEAEESERRLLEEQARIMADIVERNRREEEEARMKRESHTGKGRGGGGGRGGGRGGRGGGLGRGGRGGSSRLDPSSAPSPGSDDDDNSCIICMENVRTHSTVPCGHLKFCGDCAAKMMKEGRNTCPECRGSITQFMRVYN